jgi:hypothetical protein
VTEAEEEDTVATQASGVQRAKSGTAGVGTKSLGIRRQGLPLCPAIRQNLAPPPPVVELGDLQAQPSINV